MRITIKDLRSDIVERATKELGERSVIELVEQADRELAKVSRQVKAELIRALEEKIEHKRMYRPRLGGARQQAGIVESLLLSLERWLIGKRR